MAFTPWARQSASFNERAVATGRRRRCASRLDGPRQDGLPTHHQYSHLRLCQKVDAMGASATTCCQLNEHVALRADNFACHRGERDPLGRQLLIGRDALRRRAATPAVVGATSHRHTRRNSEAAAHQTTRPLRARSKHMRQAAAQSPSRASTNLNHRLAPHTTGRSIIRATIRPTDHRASSLHMLGAVS